MSPEQVTRELDRLPPHSRGRRVLEQIALRETTRELAREVKHIEAVFREMDMALCREIDRCVCREMA